jgi:hypothetical protein
MILIPDQFPPEQARPDCFEHAQPRSVHLGLQRMDFRHALCAPGPVQHRPTAPLPSRRRDICAPEWTPL